jgi:hypothetical protein
MSNLDVLYTFKFVPSVLPPQCACALLAGVAEAGSILLSSGGVIRVPFLQCIKPSALSVLADCLAERRVQLQTEDATELDPKRRRVETALHVQPTIWATAPHDAVGGESARGAGVLTFRFDVTLSWLALTSH